MKKTSLFSPVTGAFWSRTPKQALLQMKSNSTGLSRSDAATRMKQMQGDRFKVNRRATGLLLFLSQFKSPITVLLVSSAILSFFLHDGNAVIILIIVWISSVLGWWQEKGAANAIDRLIKQVQNHCCVVREGTEQEVLPSQIVPGDVVHVTAGDIIPGDGLLLESTELFVDEAAFTGETFPVEKDCRVLPAETPVSKRVNTLFMGSHVISGKGSLLIMNTGTQTEFGKIYEHLKRKAPETDFEKGVRKFGYLLMEITLILIVIIFAINVTLHKPILESFLFSLAIAVGLTPQLLPAIITVNLARGARVMARHHVIVKRLSAIENFGSMDLLCTDKTGTITEGKVTLNEAFSVGRTPSQKVLTYAWINAFSQRGFHNPVDEAILQSTQPTLDTYIVQSEVPYDFIRKRLTVQIRTGAENLAIMKGAFQQVIKVCTNVEMDTNTIVPLSEKREEITQQFASLCGLGFRTLGVAYKKITSGRDFHRDDEKDMTFLGFITFFDPPKKDVVQTIHALKQLGVGLKIITGDNALAARSLAGQVGMEQPAILTGEAVRKMSDTAVIFQAGKADIFAEVEPNQKERIILALKKGGRVVGFLGDGINDAAALHCADVGISVNTAVDVAKEAADIVLLKRNLNVIAKGIQEGRKTFANTLKYIFMATSANFGNMFSMAGASLFLPFLPLLPKQILLNNLLTDFPETTLATDAIDKTTIAQPRRWDIHFIQRFMIIFGTLSSLFDFITFWILLHVLQADEKHFQTGWFIESVLSASLIVLIVRTRKPFLKSLPGKYLLLATGAVACIVLILPFTALGRLFGFVVMPGSFYALIAAVIAAYILMAEVAKLWFYRNEKSQ